MTRILFALSLFATISTAFAAEPAAQAETKPKTTLHVPNGGALHRNEDGSMTILSAELAAKEAEINARLANAEANLTNAEAEALRAQTKDETSNGSVIGRASMSAENICGLKFDKEAVGRRGRQLAELYADCVRAEAVKIDAEGRAANTTLALLLDRNLHSEGDESATGNAAVPSAWSDDEGGGLGFGLGLAGAMPYGASPFQTVQRNGVGWQAVMAGQNAPVAMQMPVDPNSKQLQTTATATTTVTTTARSAPAGVPPLPPDGQVPDGKGGFRPMTDAEQARLATMKAEQAARKAAGQ